MYCLMFDPIPTLASPFGVAPVGQPTLSDDCDVHVQFVQTAAPFAVPM